MHKPLYSKRPDHKFWVYKIEDVEATNNKTLVTKLSIDIIRHRLSIGKKLNEYIVINTDEKYFWLIKLILKFFKHWD